MDKLESLFQPNQVSNREETRITYSRDASRIQGECLSVVWPETITDVIRLTQWAAETGIDLVPRGAGTGLCGGATPQNSIVVDSSRLQKIGARDFQSKLVVVDAGVPLDQFNRILRPDGLFFPVIPGSHRSATLGGMIATNAAGLHAVRYGRMSDWVEEVVVVDGKSEIQRLSVGNRNAFAGREGITGMIVQATLRLTEIPKSRSLTLFSFEHLADMLEQVKQLKTNSALSALEYLNPHAAGLVGWTARHCVLAEYHSAEGEIRDPAEMANLWGARESLSARLTQAGFPISEDPQFPPEALEDNLDWLTVQNIPVFGHLGVGILHPRFLREDARIAELYYRVSASGGQISGEHGMGLKKRQWASEALKSEVLALKRQFDPQNIFNRGKLC
ncbi:MAG: FAD-binding oxidoreductase [Anaerolineaceae bacterium]